MNWYENENNCVFERNGFSFSCEKNRKFDELPPSLFKPLILLYPTKTTPVQVELEYAGDFTATFPEYSESLRGWSGTVDSESIFTDDMTGQKIYGLFWE